MKKIEQISKKKFFEIDLQSFKTYFKTKIRISIFFHLAGTEVGIPSVHSDYGGDRGRHS